MNSTYEEIIKKLKSEKHNQHLNSKILIVDLLNLFIRGYVADPSTNVDGVHIGGITGPLKSLAYAIKMFNPTRCIIVGDGKGGSAKRKKIYPQYKANRKSNPKGSNYNRNNRFLNEEQEKLHRDNQLERLVGYLDLLPVTTIVIDYVEADDVISYICNLYPESKKIIVSADKDFIQLVNENTNVWSPIKKKVYNCQRVQEEFELLPQNFVYYKAIMGDNSDNIPGIEGFGHKTTLSFFGDILRSENCSFELMTESISDKKGKTAQSFRDNLDILDRNYELMQLYEPLISAGSQLQVKDILEGCEIPTLVKYKIQVMTLRDKLYSSIKNMVSYLETYRTLNHYAKKNNERLSKK